MTLSREDVELIDAARRRAGVPENAQATPAQVRQILGMLPATTAEALIAQWQEAAADARDCYVRNHERQIAYWQSLAPARPATTDALSGPVPNRG